jgi:hypothetical protein
MRLFLTAVFFIMVFVSCGPSAKELEQQKVQDSIKAEEDRLRAIEDADAFIAEFPEESDSLLQTLE